MSAPKQFRIVVAEPPTERQLDELFGRCRDLVVEADPAERLCWLAFDREAPTLVDAIVSAVRDLQVAGLAPVEACPDDDLVTLGVVAERVGRTPAVVRRWAAGATGPGGFPLPLDDDTPRPCYRWREVAQWLSVHFGHSPADDAHTLMAVNLAFRLRALAPYVDRMGALRTIFSV